MVLPPATTGVAPRFDPPHVSYLPSMVYLTTSLSSAEKWGNVYEVEAVGPVEKDPETANIPGWDVDYRASSARVVRRVSQRRVAAIPTLYHGSAHPFRPGDVIVPASKVPGGGNYQPGVGSSPSHVYLTDDLAQAFFFAVLSAGARGIGLPRVFEVDARGMVGSQVYPGREVLAEDATVLREVTEQAKAAFAPQKDDWADAIRQMVPPESAGRFLPHLGRTGSKKTAALDLDFEMGGSGNPVEQYDGWVAAYLKVPGATHWPKVGYLDYALFEDPYWKVVHPDGEERWFSTEGEAMGYLLRAQGQSIDWATTHEGWQFLPPAPDRLWVKMVEVVPEYRGQGVAHAMLKEVIKHQFTNWGNPVPVIVADYLTPEGQTWWRGVVQQYPSAEPEATGRIGKTASTVGPIYRGIALTDLPADLQARIEALSRMPTEVEQIDQHLGIGPLLIGYLQSSHWDTEVGLGRHWTTNRRIAEQAYGGILVVLTGRCPASSVMPFEEHKNPGWAVSSEDEVTLRPGAPVTVTDVEMDAFYLKGKSLLAAPVEARA